MSYLIVMNNIWSQNLGSWLGGGGAGRSRLKFQWVLEESGFTRERERLYHSWEPLGRGSSIRVRMPLVQRNELVILKYFPAHHCHLVYDNLVANVLGQKLGNVNFFLCH